MGLFKSLAVPVGTIAVLIGVIGKMKPEIFLNIPNIGFIIFHIFGGNNGILPPYFDISPWQGDSYKGWLKDGDVVVATAVKSGTTWMCYCMDAIRRKGSDSVGLPFGDIMYSTPWMEVPHQPGEKWSDRRQAYNTTVLPDGTKLKDYWDHPDFPFRVFKSHYEPKGEGKTAVLPVKEMPNVKYIVAFRNPLEVAKSIHAFFPKHEPAARKAWGGFPPIYPNAEAAMKAMYPEAELKGLYFGYVHGWYPYLKLPNVLVLHYNEMTKDLSALVDKLSKFAGVSLDKGEKDKVMEKCSFNHMKSHPEFFQYKAPLQKSGQYKNYMQSGGMVNKGKSGDKQEEIDTIDPEAVKEFEELVHRELDALGDPKFKKWALEGGEL